MSRDCGGRGLCGKCRILRPDLEALDSDRRVLGADLVKAGWRLSCQHRDTARSDAAPGPAVCLNAAGSDLPESQEPAVFAALDIGTTTVVLALLDERGHLVREYRMMNPQKEWGADVLTRITNWKEIPKDLIRDLIMPHLTGVKHLVITGNTVMTHLWMGVNPESLARVPFEIPVPEEVVTEQEGRTERICAPLAPYVGADIRTGLHELFARTHEDRFLYLDLGTNGEMVWYDQGAMTVCSAACGPCLEGAGISVGMPALPGAITQVRKDESGWHAQVIGDRPAVGVCGSGLISWIDALVRHGLVTSAGRLKECPPVEGLRLTQKDIRMFQLAKGALQAGWRLLVGDPVRVQEVFVAGGFSLGLDEEACIRLGLFHPAWKGKIRFCGNMALKGACRLAADPKTESLEPEVLELEKDPAFSACFADSMLLQEDRS